MKSIFNKIIKKSSLEIRISKLGIRNTLSEINQKKLTYLSKSKLCAIAKCIDRIEKTGVPGIFIEAGCALGGSSILIARTMGSERVLEIYDVFGMIPAPGAYDPPEVHSRFAAITKGAAEGLGGEDYYGYRDNLKLQVEGNLRSTLSPNQMKRVRMIEGLVQDTLHPSSPVAFAHIDVDWHEPVKHCLEAIWGNMSPGGAIIVDDYFDWGGCRTASDEFLKNNTKCSLDSSGGNLIINKL